MLLDTRAMLLRPFILAAVPFASVAFASVAATAPPPPAGLVPYVKGEHFDPGDYGWMRGAFADASPEQKADWFALMAWLGQCRQAEHAVVIAAFAQRGVTITAGDRRVGHGGLCGEVGYSLPQGDQGKSWPDFQAAVARARPVAQAIVWSAALAQSVADPDKPDQASALIARVTTDQILRGAINWGKGMVPGAPALALAEQGIANSMIWRAIADRDHANTVWLRGVVAGQGWPTIARVGERASGNAWLLVQHADDDPVFQYDMLRLMEPLAARGEIARRNYAMLDDRVRLKLSGKQRYGTQFTCRRGRHVPLSLDDEAGADRQRAAMGLDTLADNAARMDEVYGPCPPDVIPPSPARR